MYQKIRNTILEIEKKKNRNTCNSSQQNDHHFRTLIGFRLGVGLFHSQTIEQRASIVYTF